MPAGGCSAARPVTTPVPLAPPGPHTTPAGALTMAQPVTPWGRSSASVTVAVRLPALTNRMRQRTSSPAWASPSVGWRTVLVDVARSMRLSTTMVVGSLGVAVDGSSLSKVVGVLGWVRCAWLGNVVPSPTPGRTLAVNCTTTLPVAGTVMLLTCTSPDGASLSNVEPGGRWMTDTPSSPASSTSEMTTLLTTAPLLKAVMV